MGVHRVMLGLNWFMYRTRDGVLRMGLLLFCCFLAC